MKIQIKCKNCDYTADVGEKFAGKSCVCPYCNTKIIVPGSTGYGEKDDVRTNSYGENSREKKRSNKSPNLSSIIESIRMKIGNFIGIIWHGIINSGVKAKNGIQNFSRRISRKYMLTGVIVVIAVVIISSIDFYSTNDASTSTGSDNGGGAKASVVESNEVQGKPAIDAHTLNIKRLDYLRKKFDGMQEKITEALKQYKPESMKIQELKDEKHRIAGEIIEASREISKQWKESIVKIKVAEKMERGIGHFEKERSKIAALLVEQLPESDEVKQSIHELHQNEEEYTKLSEARLIEEFYVSGNTYNSRKSDIFWKNYQKIVFSSDSKRLFVSKDIRLERKRVSFPSKIGIYNIEAKLETAVISPIKENNDSWYYEIYGLDSTTKGEEILVNFRKTKFGFGFGILPPITTDVVNTATEDVLLRTDDYVKCEQTALDLMPQLMEFNPREFGYPIIVASNDGLTVCSTGELFDLTGYGYSDTFYIWKNISKDKSYYQKDSMQIKQIGEEKIAVKIPQGRIKALDISSDNCYVACSSLNNVYIYDLKTGDRLKLFKNVFDLDNEDSCEIYFNNDNSQIYLITEDRNLSKTLYIMDTKTGDKVREIKASDMQKFYNITVSPDKAYLLISGENRYGDADSMYLLDKFTVLYDVAEEKYSMLLKIGEDGNAACYSACFSNDNNYALLGYDLWYIGDLTVRPKPVERYVSFSIDKRIEKELTRLKTEKLIYRSADGNDNYRLNIDEVKGDNLTGTLITYYADLEKHYEKREKEYKFTGNLTYKDGVFTLTYYVDDSNTKNGVSYTASYKNNDDVIEGVWEYEGKISRNSKKGSFNIVSESNYLSQEVIEARDNLIRKNINVKYDYNGCTNNHWIVFTDSEGEFLIGTIDISIEEGRSKKIKSLKCIGKLSKEDDCIKLEVLADGSRIRSIYLIFNNIDKGSSLTGEFRNRSTEKEAKCLVTAYVQKDRKEHTMSSRESPDEKMDSAQDDSMRGNSSIVGKNPSIPVATKDKDIVAEQGENVQNPAKDTSTIAQSDSVSVKPVTEKKVLTQEDILRNEIRRISLDLTKVRSIQDILDFLCKYTYMTPKAKKILHGGNAKQIAQLFWSLGQKDRLIKAFDNALKQKPEVVQNVNIGGVGRCTRYNFLLQDNCHFSLVKSDGKYYILNFE